MAPAAKLALGGVLAGLMLTLAVVSARRQPAAEPAAIVPPGEGDTRRSQGDLARCRAATMPEADCEALWEAHRRHFFDEDAATAATAGTAALGGALRP